MALQGHPYEHIPMHVSHRHMVHLAGNAFNIFACMAIFIACLGSVAWWSCLFRVLGNTLHLGGRARPFTSGQHGGVAAPHCLV